MKHWRNWRAALVRLVLVLLAAPMVGGVGPTRVVAADTQSRAPGRSAGAALQPAVPLTTTRYTLTDLGTLGGLSQATTLNEAGQVVGVSSVAGGMMHAFLWQDGVMADLSQPSWTNNGAYDINEAGQVVGSLGAGAFLWQNGTATELPALGGATAVRAINNPGEVVGSVDVWEPDLDRYERHVARWHNGSLTDLGTFGQQRAIGHANNDAGQIAVWAATPPHTPPTPPSASRALLSQNGSTTDLGTLGGFGSIPFGINNAGQVVGQSDTAGGASHAFLWQNGAMIDLGTLGGGTSHAASINDAGQVVGAAEIPGGPYHAFLWQDEDGNSQSDPGEMRDLHDLILAGSGWTHSLATDINEAGQIVGFGNVGGQTRAFLLTPVAWTLMFYLAGDNDLGHTYPPILNRLEAGADNPHVNVLALWDNTPLGDSAYIAVQHDTDLNESFAYEDGVNYWPVGDLGEADMANPATLSEFITWAVQNYPAQHYALILDDHGTGLGGGLCEADLGGNACAERMDLVEMKSALATAQTQTGVKIDVLYMAMCLMAMLEDAYQFRDLADYYVASENLQRAYDEPYTFYVAGVLADSTPADVAVLLADAYADVAAADESRYTISAVDMLRLGEVVTATNALAAALDSHLEVISPTLASIAASVQRFDNKAPKGLTLANTYMDLFDFAALTSAVFSAYPDIAAAAGQVMQAVNDYVIYESHDSDADTNLDESHGVSIFFPATASSFYNPANYDFAVGANWGGGQSQAALATTNARGWGAMLVRYFETTQPGGPDDPIPPEPIAKVRVVTRLYLPLVLR